MKKWKNSCALRFVQMFGKERGRITRAAEAVGAYHALVSNWLSRGCIPPAWALKVEQATEGKITVAEILEEYEKVFPRRSARNAYAAN